MKRELKLLILIGSPLTAIKGEASQEVERTYSRARGLCEKVGEPQLLSTVLYGLWNYHLGLGEYQISLKYAGELLSIANSAQDHTNLLAAHRALGASLFWLGDLTNAHYHMEQALAFYEPQQHHHQDFLYWTDQGLHALSYTTIILWLLGYPDQALNRVCEVLTLAYKLSHAYSRAMAILLVTFARCYLREIDRTKESAKELIDCSTKNRFPILLSIGEVMHLWALGMEKKENDIIDKMNRAIEELQSIPFDNMRSFFRGLLAEVCVKYGQIEEGLTTLEEAQTWMVKTGERFWEAELHRLKGEMHSSQSVEGQMEAESCFHQAIEVAQHQRAKSLELRAAMSLSRLWQSQGKMEEAKRLLSDIYDWFTEGFDTADLKDAKALLEKLS